MDGLENIAFAPLMTITLTLLAVIDILGSVPILISLRSKMGDIHAGMATGVSGLLMILFLVVGEKLLGFMGVDISSFAIAGSIVLFILALEMVLGHDLFRARFHYQLRQYCTYCVPPGCRLRNAYDYHVATGFLPCVQYYSGHPHQPAHCVYLPAFAQYAGALAGSEWHCGSAQVLWYCAAGHCSKDVPHQCRLLRSMSECTFSVILDSPKKRNAQSPYSI